MAFQNNAGGMNLLLDSFPLSSPSPPQQLPSPPERTSLGSRAMAMRKPHLKSRFGCASCKKRRVKVPLHRPLWSFVANRQCDESGPPCSNCRARNTQCVYEPPAPARRSESSRARSLFGGDSSSGLDTASQRRRELELMHRYTSSSYRSCSASQAEYHLMQVTLPRQALQHDFLMNMMLAFAAFDLAMSLGDGSSSESAEYAANGLRYYHLGLQGYNAALGTECEDNSLAMFEFSNIKMMLDFLVPRFQDDQTPTPSPSSSYTSSSTPGVVSAARRSVLLMFSYVPTVQAVTQACWPWLLNTPVLMHGMMDANAPVDQLSDDVKLAVAQLLSVNDRTWLSQQGDIVLDGSADTNPQQDHESYQRAILHLETLFAREIEGSPPGALISWLTLMDTRFVRNFEAAKPMAELVAMHWAVLVHNLGRHTWWASYTGRELVADLSAHLSGQNVSMLTGWQECISWARRQVGLPDMVR